MRKGKIHRGEKQAFPRSEWLAKSTSSFSLTETYGVEKPEASLRQRPQPQWQREGGTRAVALRLGARLGIHLLFTVLARLVCENTCTGPLLRGEAPLKSTRIPEPWALSSHRIDQGAGVPWDGSLNLLCAIN